jgi:hypothetical protein
MLVWPRHRTLVQLSSVSGDDLGEDLTVVWEVEPGREVVPATRLPAVTEDGLPRRLSRAPRRRRARSKTRRTRMGPEQHPPVRLTTAAAHQDPRHR